ncbi:hypothetical protein JI743_07830 [Sphingopyxis sp. DHUNG17]|jgi:hypothetical protein|uniref:SH3 domain-containing protein n=1 Tax=Sphingopyxis jiangsuensis TaxID=2871171 RepID=UPI00191D564C|nr:SH3 domain-containing protein [Sphingopyxis lutea]MBL0768709.1 hypothetical protein [Sphingopyxis lutea]
MLTTMTALAMTLQAASAPALCNYAVVAGSRRDPSVWVYRSPSMGARKTAKIKAGSPVFVCAGNAEWFQVHYADGRHSCRGTTGGLDRRLASTCASGWVHRHRIAVVAR